MTSFAPSRFVQRAAAVVFAAAASMAGAQPFFSVANEGPSSLPGDVVFEAVGGVPTPIGGGPGMGLGRPGDELIGLAPVSVDPLRQTDKFVICFSVDPFAVGVQRFRITGQSLFIQSQNNQEAGDAYLSTEAIERGVGVLPPPFGMGLDNNALGVNQSPVYPNDFGLLPLADPGQFVLPDTPLDDVDATLNVTDGTPPAVFFTLRGDSPSHPFLPGVDSGATIFFDPDFEIGGNENVFAQPAQLGLDVLDNIDGLIIYDDNRNAVYDGTDTVYFTLDPDSPTLQAIGLNPGDVLVSEQGSIGLFVPASVFGLLPTDNMNAMDLVPLVNNSAEDTINSMVDCPADFNQDTEIDTLDVLAFLNAWVAGDAAADFNGDGAVDTLDVLAFLNAWASGC